MSQDRPIDRRRFFREGLRELLRPVSRAVEPIHRVAQELGNLEPPLPPAPKPPLTIARSPGGNSGDASTLLRPPGALPESQFLETCSRCARCVEVCPAQCIKIDPDGARGEGAPYIDVEVMPCILCTGLECMHHCPTGALVPTPLEEIDMGTAQWHEHICVRSHGEPCTMCVDHCPVGPAALEVIDEKIVVHPNGCTGCGVCQNNCPTNPRSITVMPKAARNG